MKHLRLVGLESEREALLRALQDMGCVEVSGVDGAEDALQEGFARPDDRALLSAQERARSYRTALAVLDRYAPEKKGMFRKRAAVAREEFFSAESEQAARAAADELNAMQRRLGEIESERAKEETLRASLAPWLTLDVPLEQEDGALCVTLGTVNAAVTDEALNAACATFDGLALWREASADRSLRYLFIACHESVNEAAMTALREIGFSPVSFRGLQGTAKEIDAAAQARLNALRKEREEIEQRIASLGGKREALLEASDRAAITLRREEAKSRLVGTDKVFLLEGWLPADRCAALEKALEPYFLSARRASSSASSSRCQGSSSDARSLIFRLSGVMETPAARSVSISLSRFSQSSATPLPRMLTTPSRKMPLGSRCRANLPFSLTTV